jgi:glutamate/tyrosine decarboxylase-like PLP-dependent enzyme
MDNRPLVTLDPDDWAEARAVAHRAVDDAITHLAEVRQRKVWQPVPDATRASYRTGVPHHPTPLPQIYDDLRERLLRHPMGNIHPRFFAWYMGSSNFTGALGDFLAAIDGSNLGGCDTAAAATELQVLDWLRELMGFPEGTGGTLTSGGSMANLVGLTVARNAMAGVDVRALGVTDLPKPLRYYASDQVHSAHQKSMEMLGLGSKALRLVPTGDDFRMDVAALAGMIAKDRAAGLQPACVIATAGTTNTGAIDDLVAIAALCKQEGLWFHIDGCIGAFLRLAPESRALVDGLDLADSLALDPHKWLQTPFDCGCALVRDGKQQYDAFTLHGDYLQMTTRGILAGPFMADYGFELSRGFRALKLWMALKEHGVDRFGALIDQHVAMGHALAGLVRAEPRLELMAPVTINIVCFRYRGAGGSEDQLRALNTEVMLRIQESGVALPTDTTLRGRHSLRAAIVNHRTRPEDLEVLVSEILRWGELLEATGFASAQG